MTESHSPLSTYDIAIVGGGMVGSTLALALAPLGKRIAIIEAKPFPAENQPSFDDRAVAIGEGSRRILQGIGLWEALQTGSEAINAIEVSDNTHRSNAFLSAETENVESFGQVIEVRKLGKLLEHHIHRAENIDYFSPVSVESFNISNTSVSINLSSGQTINSKLLVGADGTNSNIRRTLGLDGKFKNYNQTALITTVQMDKPHHNQAYERFTDNGPLAFLPLPRGRMSVVWVVNQHSAAELIALSDEEFASAILTKFGERLGGIKKLGQRGHYELALTFAKRVTSKRSVLIGNAAHTLHPVAGQGYNLCLRDIAAFAEVATQHQDWGSVKMLGQYEKAREFDYNRVKLMTDALVTIFSNNHPLITKARALGLALTEESPLIKTLLTQQSMGLLLPKDLGALGAGKPITSH